MGVCCGAVYMGCWVRSDLGAEMDCISRSRCGLGGKTVWWVLIVNSFAY